ncbi:MAG: hypothetical protein LQ350_003114 [Teloschistes chrysophthalmus]|nr:MAG: hypothetical protein LQ350_003114 [Niorma chrysophthalma]
MPKGFIRDINAGTIVWVLTKELHADDHYKCRALLTRGHWLDPPTEPYLSHPFENWQPPGCLMHEYTGKDIRNCLDGQNILYVGDSTARQLFWATAKKLNATAADEEMREADRHKDLTFEWDGVIVDFIWDPFLNSSSLRREVLPYADFRTHKHDKADQAAGLITIGAGLWYAQHFESDWLDRFRSSVDGLVPLLSVKNGAESATPGPVSSMFRSGALHAYLAPVQVPLYDVLSPSRASTMTPDKINPMNEYLYNVSQNSGVKVIWSQLLMTRNNEFAYEESGLHVVEGVASRRVDVALNMRCNAELSLKQGYPFDKTCCSAYERTSPSWTWYLVVWSFSLLLLAGLGMHGKESIRNLLSNELFRAIGTMISVLVYCYVADRTQLLNKTQKHFEYPEFLLLSAIAAALGVLSIRRSTADASSNAQSVAKQQGADQSFLSRDQTDEWKGWMQFVILIYHYTGASRVLWIYQIIRVLVASYLFMTGFGHALFFYRKQDYSIKRCASVLVRLNMLSCLLPFVMDTDYLFYYFAPLVSFWFTVVYLTMRIGHSHNASSPFLLSKIGLSAIAVNGLLRYPNLLEETFALLQQTCGIHWNVREWRFRLQLDLYIVYVGMLAAILYSRISDNLHKQRFPPQNHITTLQRHWRTIRLLSVIVALMTLPAFWMFARRFRNKFDYNWWVPYLSPFPIVSFIILRNCSRWFRNMHSSIFSWLGRCSLETFTLQFHIWLAADTKGLLSLGIFGRNITHTDGRRCDLIVLTIVFLWLSWLTADATATITRWIIDPERFGHERDTNSMPLPTMKKSGRNLLWTLDRADDQPKHGGILSRIVKAMCAMWTARLEVRLFSIVLSMWLLNMSYA